MVVGAKVCDLTDGFLWFVCGLYVGILTSPLNTGHDQGSAAYFLQLVTTHNISHFLGQAVK